MRAAGAWNLAAWYWQDEMRLGLRGQTRRVWAPRGVQVRQRLQLCDQWRYLVLGVNGITGQLRWGWAARMRQEEVAQAMGQWEAEGVIWDGAGSHRGRRMAETGFKRVFLPPYAPELNPAERVFEEARRAVEGRCYATLEEKAAAVSAFLERLAAESERVRRLTGWDWIKEAVAPFSKLRHIYA